MSPTYKRSSKKQSKKFKVSTILSRADSAYMNVIFVIAYDSSADEAGQLAAFTTDGLVFDRCGYQVLRIAMQL